MRTNNHSNRGSQIRDSHNRYTDQYRSGYHNPDYDPRNEYRGETYYNRGEDNYYDDERELYTADYDDNYYDGYRDENGMLHDDYTREYDRQRFNDSGRDFAGHYSQQYGGAANRSSGNYGTLNAGRNAYYTSHRNNHYIDKDRYPQGEYHRPSDDRYENDYQQRPQGGGGYSSYSSRGNAETRESRNGRYGSGNGNSSRGGSDYYSSRSNGNREQRNGRYGSTHGSSGRGYSDPYSSERYSGGEHNPMRQGDYTSSHRSDNHRSESLQRSRLSGNRGETLYSFGGYDSASRGRSGSERTAQNSRSYYYDDGQHDKRYQLERDGSYHRQH